MYLDERVGGRDGRGRGRWENEKTEREKRNGCLGVGDKVNGEGKLVISF